MSSAGASGGGTGCVAPGDARSCALHLRSFTTAALVTRTRSRAGRHVRRARLNCTGYRPRIFPIRCPLEPLRLPSQARKTALTGRGAGETLVDGRANVDRTRGDPSE
ncbi:unnamed protein product [Leptidea sinapis]|uniref:Uncharacterized protein n=1 Tax=Leptidea sinapis TaxID=189913 RepID=A0A5E4QLI7_9NEOP|nr:unnamed protein product [Leptidea sinapis]